MIKNNQFCTFFHNTGLKANTGKGLRGCHFKAKTRKVKNIFILHVSPESLCWQGFCTYYKKQYSRPFLASPVRRKAVALYCKGLQRF